MKINRDMFVADKSFKGQKTEIKYIKQIKRSIKCDTTSEKKKHGLIDDLYESLTRYCWAVFGHVVKDRLPEGWSSAEFP